MFREHSVAGASSQDDLTALLEQLDKQLAAQEALGRVKKPKASGEE